MILLKKVGNKCRCFAYSFLALLSFANASYGWSGDGHRYITKLAYQRMTDQSREYCQQLFKKLKPQLTRSRKGLSESQLMAEVAVWADSLRDSSLEDIFSSVGAKLPESLAQYGHKKTATWHFHNHFYYPDKLSKTCNLKNSGQLVEIMPILDSVLTSEASELQKAVVLAFQMHLIEDIHQPLHTLSRVNQNCEHDRGGNLLCLSKDQQRKCSLNLHQLWDRGFGIFDPPVYFTKGNKVSDVAFKPERWLVEGVELAADIYEIKPKYLVSKEYREKSRIVASKRIEFAAQRLVAYIQTLVSKKK